MKTIIKSFEFSPSNLRLFHRQNPANNFFVTRLYIRVSSRKIDFRTAQIDSNENIAQRRIQWNSISTAVSLRWVLQNIWGRFPALVSFSFYSIKNSRTRSANTKNYRRTGTRGWLGPQKDSPEDFSAFAFGPETADRVSFMCGILICCSAETFPSRWHDLLQMLRIPRHVVASWMPSTIWAHVLATAFLLCSSRQLIKYVCIAGSVRLQMRCW